MRSLGFRRFWGRIASPLRLFLLLWVLPAAAWVAFSSDWRSGFYVVLGQLLLLAVYANVRPLAARSPYTRVLAWVLSVVAALFILLQLITVEYFVVQGDLLDPFFALDNYQETVPAVVSSFSVVRLVAGISLTLLMWAGCFYGLSKVRFALPRGWRGHGMAHAVLPLLVVLLWGHNAPYGLLKAGIPLLLNTHRLNDSDEGITGAKGDVGVVTRRFGKFHSKDGAPVFIVQLESGNALALSGKATPNAGLSAAQLMPTLLKASEEGVFVPFMWGSSMQTHRGQGAILCSAVMDIYAGISMGDAIPKGCLPQKLASDGYRTVFLSAHPDPNFAHTQRFMEGIGFQETHFADKMKRGDTKYEWGYDDCDFYDAYFDFLEKKYGEAMNGNFMVYFTVSAAHDTFEPKKKYSQFMPFEPVFGFAQKYLNSFASQDHCLSRFLERVEPYREKAHIIIVADHSWPLGVSGNVNSEKGATTDNFLIPFVYLPPRGQKDAFRSNVTITKPMLGQVDIYPTLLELLSGKPYDNSFAALLHKGKDGAEPQLPPDYDDCQVMSQPYDGSQVVVVRGKDKVSYKLSTHTFVKGVLPDDLIEPIVEKGALGGTKDFKYRSFLETYMCERFKYWVKSPQGPRAVPYTVPHWSF